MPNLQQIAYECTICYELFDEIEHRPLTLICENDTCGHTYCLKCIKEITKQAETRKCPTCNASFKYTITNWFVIDLIKTSTYDIDNPYLEVLIDDISKLEISLAEYSRLVEFESICICSEAKLDFCPNLLHLFLILF